MVGEGFGTHFTLGLNPAALQKKSVSRFQGQAEDYCRADTTFFRAALRIFSASR